MTTTIIATIAAFLIVILLLVSLLLFAKSKLAPSGAVKLLINGEKTLEVDAGDTILTTLGNQKIFLPSACGGGGTCAMCKCQVFEGGGEILPTEAPYFSRKEISENWRLGCQVKVKQDMKIGIPEEIFGIKKWECEVVSNYNVASFIKEFVVRLPEGENLDFEAGGYIQIVMLNIRIATPPWDRAKNKWMDVNPGICSSYVFGCKPGDKVTISGPYGEFFIKDTGAEMVYIGGGAGMAPMRSHLFHLFHTLKTDRKVSFWYGGRSKRELFYLEHFRNIEKEFPNFSFHVVLSEPMPDDNWKVKDNIEDEGDGFTGFVHQAVIDQYLKKHDAPEDIEFYFCGPPLMNAAVLKMVDDWGVPPENVAFDDFGG
ncbi:MAG: NADH:ubiquinone reductase (Na(+)-transporting) subunit F [Flavobacteriales bacterium]|nr:NADH:ubiquinone reductase (Na(+)-transporting) subunit F [Flavobacteriales bacterium]